MDMTRIMGGGLRKFSMLLAEDRECTAGLLALMRPKNNVAEVTVATGLRALRLTLFFDPAITSGEGEEHEAARVRAMEAMVNNGVPSDAHTEASKQDSLDSYSRSHPIVVGMRLIHKEHGIGEVVAYESDLWGSLMSPIITLLFHHTEDDESGLGGEEHSFPCEDWYQLETP